MSSTTITKMQEIHRIHPNDASSWCTGQKISAQKFGDFSSPVFESSLPPLCACQCPAPRSKNHGPWSITMPGGGGATTSTTLVHQLLGSANAETTSRNRGRSGRQNAARRRSTRREERVTVQGPVKKQQPDGMSHRGAAWLILLCLASMMLLHPARPMLPSLARMMLIYSARLMLQSMSDVAILSRADVAPPSNSDVPTPPPPPPLSRGN